jgi:NADH-quinone oxidoreductase subunit M
VETFPYLSVLTFLPMVGALVILLIPHISQSTARTVALITAVGSFVVSILAYLRFDPNAPFNADNPVPLQERIEWGREVGASYFMGVDGIAILLVLLTTLFSVIAIVWSWDTVNTRTREYYIALLLLETGMLGVFVSLDLFLFYIFWELVR